MELIITNHTVIKPSSPTSVTSRHHKLSSLDQLSPQLYVPLIFFYENKDESKHEPEQICRRLKQSLSEILTIFYPLGGTIKQNSFVDCDDRGAEFVEARVHGRRIAQLMQAPKMEELRQLTTIDSSSHNDDALLSVKISYFECGGISVGACLSHKLADMASFATFMNAWAANCRGESSRIIHPSFDMALHFPPREALCTAPGYDEGITKEIIVTKRLVFEREKVDELRRLASSDEVEHPTAVEAVSVFLWKCFIQTTKASMKCKEQVQGPLSFIASQVVNLRPKVVPQLPDHSFGNYVTFGSAVVSEDDDDDDVDYASRMRASIRAVDDDYINTVVKGERYLAALAKLFDSRNLILSSWWRFPLYDVDFGWGKPVWVSMGPVPYVNACIFMSTPSGDGIEAWINISHDEDNDNDQDLFQSNYDKLFTT